MRFLIEAVYCMTWIWTLHSAHNKSKSPIEEDNIWARPGQGGVWTDAVPAHQTEDTGKGKA